MKKYIIILASFCFVYGLGPVHGSQLTLMDDGCPRQKIGGKMGLGPDVLKALDADGSFYMEMSEGRLTKTHLHKGKPANQWFIISGQHCQIPETQKCSVKGRQTLFNLGVHVNAGPVKVRNSVSWLLSFKKPQGMARYDGSKKVGDKQFCFYSYMPKGLKSQDPSFRIQFSISQIQPNLVADTLETISKGAKDTLMSLPAMAIKKVTDLTGLSPDNPLVKYFTPEAGAGNDSPAMMSWEKQLDVCPHEAGVKSKMLGMRKKQVYTLPSNVFLNTTTVKMPLVTGDKPIDKPYNQITFGKNRYYVISTLMCDKTNPKTGKCMGMPMPANNAENVKSVLSAHLKSGQKLKFRGAGAMGAPYNIKQACLYEYTLEKGNRKGDPKKKLQILISNKPIPATNKTTATACLVEKTTEAAQALAGAASGVGKAATELVQGGYELCSTAIIALKNFIEQNNPDDGGSVSSEESQSQVNEKMGGARSSFDPNRPRAASVSQSKNASEFVCPDEKDVAKIKKILKGMAKENPMVKIDDVTYTCTKCGPFLMYKNKHLSGNNFDKATFKFELHEASGSHCTYKGTHTYRISKFNEDLGEITFAMASAGSGGTTSTDKNLGRRHSAAPATAGAHPAPGWKPARPSSTPTRSRSTSSSSESSDTEFFSAEEASSSEGSRRSSRSNSASRSRSASMSEGQTSGE